MPLPRILKLNERVYCPVYDIINTPLTNGRVIELTVGHKGESVIEVKFDCGLRSEFRCVEGGLFTDFEGNLLFYENPAWKKRTNIVSRCVVFVIEVTKKLLFWIQFRKGA